MTPAPTPDEIEAARTQAGGWTRAQLAEWGVPWPPPKGWRRALEQSAPIPARAGRETAGIGTHAPIHAEGSAALPFANADRGNPGPATLFTTGE